MTEQAPDQATCSECRVAAPLHAFFCTRLELPEPPRWTAPRADRENHAWDEAEAALDRELDREHEADPDWCWQVAP